MKEFIEKLIGRLEEERKRWTDNIDFLEQTIEYQDRRIEVAKSQGYSGAYFNSIEIVKELAEKYQSRVMIDEQFCWQTCVCTDRCNECNRLADGEFDYYESIGEWEEEYINTSTDKSTEQPTWKQQTMNRFERVE